MVLDEFKKQFGSTEGVRMYQAPARINIIGEHVDYLGGSVLPAAIDFFIKAAIKPTERESYRFYSLNYESFYESSEITKSEKSPWVNYIMGVMYEFEKRGCKIPKFDLAFGGDIPTGSGLSSSAALEVVIGYALNEIFQFGMDKKEIAQIGQSAENHFVGTKCGIMDQFAIAFGKENHCIELNTSTLEYKYHPFRTGRYKFSLVQSNVKHTLNESEYNTRRIQCESALRKINEFRRKENLPPIAELYDLSKDFTSDSIESLTLEEKLRIRHVLTEKERTKAVIESLKKEDFHSLGIALTECHWSLSKNFEVSCVETDFLVNHLNEKGALGSRMIGGGFGGCVLVLGEEGWIDSIFEDVNQKYKASFGREADLLNFKIADGVRRIL